MFVSHSYETKEAMKMLLCWSQGSCKCEYSPRN